MITLYGFRSAFGLPDLSPFVTKVETYFHMAGVPFEKKTGDQRKAPRGKFMVATGVRSTGTRWLSEA